MIQFIGLLRSTPELYVNSVIEAGKLKIKEQSKDVADEYGCL